MGCLVDEDEKESGKGVRKHARAACSMFNLHTHTNIESHNMKTIEQQMRNIQQLIPYKLSCWLMREKWRVRQRDKPTRQKFVLFINGEH